MKIWKEQRCENTPYPQYRYRAKLFGLIFTLWTWYGPDV